MTSITTWVVLWKVGIVFGVIPQLQSVIISALFLAQLCVPSSRYGRRDSLQVVGIPHSFPMERSLLICKLPPSLDATAMQGGARLTLTEEDPLRWDMLPHGQGLFLEQTLP